MSLESMYQNVFTVVILATLFLWLYSKKKGQTMKETMERILDTIKGEEDGH